MQLGGSFVKVVVFALHLKSHASVGLLEAWPKKVIKLILLVVKYKLLTYSSLSSSALATSATVATAMSLPLLVLVFADTESPCVVVGGAAAVAADCVGEMTPTVAGLEFTTAAGFCIGWAVVELLVAVTTNCCWLLATAGVSVTTNLLPFCYK